MFALQKAITTTKRPSDTFWGRKFRLISAFQQSKARSIRAVPKISDQPMEAAIYIHCILQHHSLTSWLLNARAPPDIHKQGQLASRGNNSRAFQPILNPWLAWFLQNELHPFMQNILNNSVPIWALLSPKVWLLLQTSPHFAFSSPDATSPPS